MDLIDCYIQNEKGHVKLLIKRLENPSRVQQDEFFSNLFNFKVNFDTNRVTIEDDTGCFSHINPKRSLSCSLEQLHNRLLLSHDKSTQ
jgi:hypothetical protein